MSPESAKSTARRVFFSGRVQGVGFRYTTCDLARRFEITGYVRNLADGRVELLCEGDPDETARFIDAVRREMGGFIGEMISTEEPPTQKYAGFGIRY